MIFVSFATYSSEKITLTKDNTLSLRSAFSGQSVAKLIEEATKLDTTLKSGYPMYLVLYTPGGSIQAGLELFDYLDGLNRPIHTITLFAASMGFQTVQHLGKRFITRYGVLMAHKARGGFQGEFGGGVSQLDSRYGMWLRRVEMMDKLTVKRTEGKISSLKKFYSLYAPELWLNGNEAVKIGLADSVAVIKCDPTLHGTKTQEFNFGFFSLLVEFSLCPTRTAPISIKANILTNKGEMSLKKFLLDGGKFGKRCVVSGTEDYLDRWGTVIPGSKADLCPLDNKLSFDKLNKAKTDKIKFFNRNLKDHVIRSY